jgi:hypothetical protein
MRLTVGQDDGARAARPVSWDPSQQIVDLTERVAAQPERLALRERVGDGVNASELSLESVSDPLYQAFVATGFLRAL